jgi:hypothetical protein
MARPTKQQIAEARKQGIVEGALIESPVTSNLFGTVSSPSQWIVSPDGSIANGCGKISLRWGGEWATVITSPKRKAPTQPRIKGRFAPKPKEQPDRIKQIELDVNRHGVALITAVDRIEGYLNKVGQVVVDQGREFKSKLNRIEGSVTERLDALRMERYALAQDTPIDPLMNNGIDAPTFLSRARVTAKDLGLKPVEAPAELNVGDWVEVIAPAGASDIIGCDRYRGTIAQVEPWSTYVTKEKAFYIRSIDCWFRASSLRKLSEAEIAAHLAAEESKCKEAERAEKVAKLRFGVRVRTAHGVGIYQMEDEHGAHVVVHPDTTGYHGIDQITILP